MTTKTSPRRIDYLPLVGLVPSPRNPKGHDLLQLDASVARFGFIEPIVLDERTGHIISGHGRVEALLAQQKRGEAPPDGVRVNGTGEWLAPVTVGWASRNDTEASAALIVLNRSGERGGWVDDTLLELLDELAAVPEGMVAVGFTGEEMETLRAKLEAAADTPVPDVFPEYDDEIPTAYACPSCGFEWSGNPAPASS